MSLSTLEIRVDRLKSVSPVPTDLGTGTGAFLPGGIFHLKPGGMITSDDTGSSHLGGQTPTASAAGLRQLATLTLQDTLRVFSCFF